MECRLCKRDGNLKKSHIIPEFLYSALYDNKHRFYELRPKKKIKYLQKGIRECLLCGSCEQHLSKYEQYASQMLKGEGSLRYWLDGSAVRIGGVDYKLFKLFALSILWRASISKLSIFSGVSLGVHEEKLRLMILAGEPGAANLYPFIISPVMYRGDVVEALIVPPVKTRLGGYRAYIFVCGGLAWIYVVCSAPVPKIIVDASLCESGLMTMIPWGISDMKFITSMASDLIRPNDS